MAAATADEATTAATRDAVARLGSGEIRRLRVAWADLHGVTRCKTLAPAAAVAALTRGIAFVGTPLLKDTSDRTAVPVFDPGAIGELQGFAQAANLILRPDPRTLVELPWSPGTAWVLGDSFNTDGSACAVDPRRMLKRQAARLRQAGYRLQCGLEVEFHVYRVAGDSPHLDPLAAEWPGPAPKVALLHAGYRLLSEESADAAHQVLELIEATALGLGLPLTSLEIEFGPSQFEAVFDVLDAEAAADAMVLFRTAVRQVLARHGYLATFVCRPPFPFVMSSGWHLHQSLVDAAGRNAFEPAAGQRPRTGLSSLGESWLAGLLQGARASCLLGTPTANGYARFRPNALAPTHVRWGRDDRAALLRVVGDGAATRIENRLGEPCANPYLYIGSQIIDGLEAVERGLTLAAAETALGDAMLPADLGSALAAFAQGEAMRAQLGTPLSRVLELAKASEWRRYANAADREEFDRREYFGRF